MHLNLPVLDQLSSCRNLLIAGMGGGFDLFSGLPIYFELLSRGQRAHLASLSFSPHVPRLKTGVRLSPTLVSATAEHQGVVIYFPELYLTHWFRDRRGEEVPVWCFQNKGAQGLLSDYRALVQHLAIDGILLVDGGVDSLMRGDEATLGTVIDDAVTLAAVSQLDEVPVRLLSCLGFGAEQEITHSHAFENIAGLTEAGGFLGSCSLVRQMDACQAYEDAVLYVQAKRFQDPSVIASSVVSAVRGRYGDYHLTEKTHGRRLWISPLMPIYWFFDAMAVAERNLFLSQLQWTQSYSEAAQVLAHVRRNLTLRAPTRVPLP